MKPSACRPRRSACAIRTSSSTTSSFTRSASLSVVTGASGSQRVQARPHEHRELHLTRRRLGLGRARRRALVVVAAAVTLPMTAGARPHLPQRSAAQLLVDVSKADGTPLSGTVVETARLGFPALPDVGGASITPMSLVAGSHTARVWYDGADKARVALSATSRETDLVRNGRDVWLWTSGVNSAQHATLPAEDGRDCAGADRRVADPAAGRREGAGGHRPHDQGDRRRHRVGRRPVGLRAGAAATGLPVAGRRRAASRSTARPASRCGCR